MSKNRIALFEREIQTYYRHHRREFPWRLTAAQLRRRQTPNPYHILVSEVMLQQTQTARVVGKYREFLKSFPTLETLAQASPARVLAVWQGMGYNRRALYLQRSATIIVNDYSGTVPQTTDQLVKLPGIGFNTAGAIMAFAFNQPIVFIETNIRRVFIHFFFSRAKNVHDDRLWPIMTAALYRKNPRQWYEALMDYGAYLADHTENQNRRSRHYTKQSIFNGSARQARGTIIKLLLTASRSEKEIITTLGTSSHCVATILSDLAKEGFIVKTNARWALKR